MQHFTHRIALAIFYFSVSLLFLKSRVILFLTCQMFYKNNFKVKEKTKTALQKLPKMFLVKTRWIFYCLNRPRISFSPPLSTRKILAVWNFVLVKTFLAISLTILQILDEEAMHVTLKSRDPFWKNKSDKSCKTPKSLNMIHAT